MIRVVALACALCGFSLPAAGQDFSRAEVEAITGESVDRFSPSADLGLPYAPGVVARSYVVEDRPMFAAVSVAPPKSYLVTVLFDGEGQMIHARQQLLGQIDAPVGDITESLKRLLRRRRT